MLDLRQREAVSDLILSVGSYIRVERNQFHIKNVVLKDIHDLVSYVDKSAEEQLLHGLLNILPDAGVLAEETGEVQSDSLYKWIVDPLDGTTNFIHQIPHYCISVALEMNGSIVHGWVYEIVMSELYMATKGEGASMNGLAIQCSQTTETSNSLIATGFPVRNYPYLDNYLRLQKWMIVNTRGIRRLGTAAYDLCLVAAGKADVYFEPGLSAWDVAAGSLIVEEAGGKVTDFRGGENFVFGKQILASNSYIHADIISEIQQCMPL